MYAQYILCWRLSDFRFILLQNDFYLFTSISSMNPVLPYRVPGTSLGSKQCRGYRVSFARMPWDQSYISQVHLKEAAQHSHLGRKNGLVSGRQTWNPTIFNIIHWVAWTNDSSTKCLIFQVLFFFFHNFLQSSLQKSFQFIFLFYYNITKKKNWVP